MPMRQHLESYVAALESGWSPDTNRPVAAKEELSLIQKDPQGFIEQMDHRDGGGPPVILPNGESVPRLPGIRLWLWDGEFCGQVGLRWQPDSVELPSYCPGHVGYSVVPWRRRIGYATQALRKLLPIAAELGLPHLDVAIGRENTPSRRVAEANGAKLVGEFMAPAHAAEPMFLYRITLSSANALSQHSALSLV